MSKVHATLAALALAGRAAPALRARSQDQSAASSSAGRRPAAPRVHTASDVLVTACARGPRVRRRFAGVQRNVDMFFQIADVLE